ncbi:MAG: hypothetical protein NTY74_03010 [Ignavibacteriae bacterium]|nr:hypothetical protein [Ignavibacteriota bacterium]
MKRTLQILITILLFSTISYSQVKILDKEAPYRITNNYGDDVIYHLTLKLEHFDSTKFCNYAEKLLNSLGMFSVSNITSSGHLNVGGGCWLKGKYDDFSLDFYYRDNELSIRNYFANYNTAFTEEQVTEYKLRLSQLQTKIITDIQAL